MIIGVEYETEIEHKSLQLSDRSSCVTDCVSGLLGQCECKQRQYAPVASALLTSCGHYGIIMLGHNMSCLSRVRTDNRTLLCVLYRPWITISDSHKWQGPRYVHPWQCQTRFDPPSLRSSCQSHRMSNNPCRRSCKLSSRLQCYHPVHSRAVDKLIPNHGPSSNAKRIFGSHWICWKSQPGHHDAWPIKMANKQRFYCPHGSNSVLLLTRTLLMTFFIGWIWTGNVKIRLWRIVEIMCFLGDTHMLGGHFKSSSGALQLKTC